MKKLLSLPPPISVGRKADTPNAGSEPFEQQSPLRGDAALKQRFPGFEVVIIILHFFDSP
jgi:hypothetical protein